MVVGMTEDEELQAFTDVSPDAEYTHHRETTATSKESTMRRWVRTLLLPCCDILFSPSGYSGCRAYTCRDTSDVRNGNAVLLEYTLGHQLHDRIEE